MPSISILFRTQQLAGESPSKALQETAQASMRTLLKMVADHALTVEEGLECIDFGAEEDAPVDEGVLLNEQPLRFRFACDRDAMRIVLMLVRDGDTAIEKALSCINFSGEPLMS